MHDGARDLGENLCLVSVGLAPLFCESAGYPYLAGWGPRLNSEERLFWFARCAVFTTFCLQRL